MMRLLVCGSRNWINLIIIRELIANLHPACIIEGCAHGADACAETAARELNIPIEHHPADWKRYGRRAGYIRNKAMLAAKPDMVLAFWDAKSPGTRDMIKRAQKAGIKTRIYYANPGDCS